MKRIIAILAIIASTFYNVNAQTFPAVTPSTSSTAARGGINAGGTYLSIGYLTGQNCTIITGTVTPAATSHPDTLKSPATGITGYKSDTGYTQFSYASSVHKLFDFSITPITGTLAGKAILQGSRDGQTWYKITGATATCAGCISDTATLSGSGTTHYQWFVPKDVEIYPLHQVRVIVSGTVTATFATTLTTAY